MRKTTQLKHGCSNRHLSKKDKKVTSKYRKRCSDISHLGIDTILGWLKFKILIIPSVGENVEKLQDPYTLLLEMQNARATL